MQNTFIGMVATTPKLHLLGDGNEAFVNFRFAVNEGDTTSWFTVTTKGKLAKIAYDTLTKTDRIIVTGQLKIEDWDNGETFGTTAHIEAETIGKEISYGNSKVTEQKLMAQAEADNLRRLIGDISEVINGYYEKENG